MKQSPFYMKMFHEFERPKADWMPRTAVGVLIVAVLIAGCLRFI